jgi:DNA-binding IclR family transcriptional regulator
MELSHSLPAPALAKGLFLLEQLAVDGQASLEQLAKKNGWPKSSVLRYLKTLESLEIVSQNPETLHWQSKQRLKPVCSPLPQEVNALQSELPRLADQTGHCAEIYLAGNRILRLIDRAEPEESEVQVNARIGFQRDLRELDATSGIYFAFRDTPPPSEMWWWEDGEISPVPKDIRDRTLCRIRKSGFAVDHSFNENGIRRHALPILDGTHLTGVLAIAQRLTPKYRIEGERIRKILDPISTSLNSRISPSR